MRKRSLGKTGLDVSELGLGTWGLSGDAYGSVDEAEQDRVIERAAALGINLFETADCYGKGRMETRLAERLNERKDAVIVTKLGTDLKSAPPRKRFDAAFLREAFEASRERLKRDVIDVVLLHNPSSRALSRDDTLGFLRELKADGRIRAWGVSAGSGEIARTAIAQGAELLEVAYNAFASKDLTELQAEIERTGVGILARSVLAHGLLCGLWPMDKRFPSFDHRAERWTSDELKQRIRQLSALRPVVSGDVSSLRGAALRFVLNSNLVSCAVLGPRSCLQLDQLVREAGKQPYLTPNAVTALAARLREAGVEA